MNEAMAANNLTTQGINELWQQERDLMNYSWTSAENQVQRDHEIAKTKLDADGAKDSALSSAAGSFVSTVLSAGIQHGGWFS